MSWFNAWTETSAEISAKETTGGEYMAAKETGQDGGFRPNSKQDGEGGAAPSPRSRLGAGSSFTPSGTAPLPSLRFSSAALAPLPSATKGSWIKGLPPPAHGNEAQQSFEGGVFVDELPVSKPAPKLLKVEPKRHWQAREGACLVDVGGCASAVRALRELVELPTRYPEIYRALGSTPPFGVLLHGPSGCGKTLLATAAANEAGVPFTVVNAADVLGREPAAASKQLRNIFENARATAPSAILIDQVEMLAPRKDGGGDVGGTAVQVQASADVACVAAQLITLLDAACRNREQDRVIVMACTSRLDELDAGLRRAGRFDVEIELTLPDAKGRLEILRCHTRELQMADDVSLEEIAARAQGFVGADVGQLCAEAGLICVREAALVDQDGRSGLAASDAAAAGDAYVTQAQFLAAMELVGAPSSLREVTLESPNVPWDSVGGLDELKEELLRLVEWPLQHADIYREMGVAANGGVLMYGPPGCGKTLLAKAVATRCSANFLAASGAELLGSGMGESESLVRQLFSRARAARPCVVFLDEMDAIGSSGGGGKNRDSQIMDRVLATILTELDICAEAAHGVGGESDKDSAGVVVIGATNRPNVLDQRLLRPGRLEHAVHVKLPDAGARREILRAALSDAPLHPDVEPLLDELAQDEATAGYSGADLAELCRRACKHAIAELIEREKDPTRMSSAMNSAQLLVEHVTKAFGEARRSVSDEDAAFVARMEVSWSAGTELMQEAVETPEQLEEQLAGMVRELKKAADVNKALREQGEALVVQAGERGNTAELLAAMQAATAAAQPAEEEDGGEVGLSSGNGTFFGSDE